MFSRIASALGLNFESRDEVVKFGFLATIFGLIIGTYWALRPLKDSLFNTLIGLKAWQPTAKVLSVLVIFPLVMIYSKLIDKFRRDHLFYALVGFYAVLALVFAYFFMHPQYGLANTTKSPYRILGWLWYVYVESFGSLIVALFWAFATDTTKPESASRGFPVVSAFAQFGNIIFPFFMTAQTWGFATSAPIVALCGVFMLLMVVLFWVMMRVVSPSQWIGYHAKHGEEQESEPGLIEGLKLLISHGYLIGLFFVITAYETIITTLDYHFKALSGEMHPGEIALSAYLSKYASLVGIVAFLCVILGINNIQKRLGIVYSLILLPMLVGVAVFTIWANPTALTVALCIMVLSKAINYALNQPTMKQLYIPTTKDTRYKAQAWIEMFGSRGSKGLSSSWNNFNASLGTNTFLTFTMIFSAGIIPVWILAALYLAKTYNKAMKENTVVC